MLSKKILSFSLALGLAAGLSAGVFASECQSEIVSNSEVLISIPACRLAILKSVSSISSPLVQLFVENLKKYYDGKLNGLKSEFDFLYAHDKAFKKAVDSAWVCDANTGKHSHASSPCKIRKHTCSWH